MLYDKRWDAKIVPKESELIERLKRAREIVATNWCPKGGRDRKGALCALLAITHDIPHGAFLRGEGKDAVNAVQRVIGWDNVIGWNDAPGRTQDEVVAAFDKAIQLARQS